MSWRILQEPKSCDFVFRVELRYRSICLGIGNDPFKTRKLLFPQWLKDFQKCQLGPNLDAARMKTTILQMLHIKRREKSGPSMSVN